MYRRTSWCHFNTHRGHHTYFRPLGVSSSTSLIGSSAGCVKPGVPVWLLVTPQNVLRRVPLCILTKDDHNLGSSGICLFILTPNGGGRSPHHCHLFFLMK